MDLLREKVAQTIGRGGRVAVVGVGAELRGDDFAGVKVAEAVNTAGNPLIRGFIGATAPENITGEIVAFQPELTVFVDAADLGLSPGETRLIERGEIGGSALSTHTLPLPLIIDYLALSVGGEYLVLGIQPKHLTALAPLSPEMEMAIERVSRWFND